jgi:membrane protein YdbS with pleckstrin-like domain
MPELKIRPSTTLATLSFIVAVLLAIVIYYFSRQSPSQAWLAAYIVPAIFVFQGIRGHIRAQLTYLELVGDRLKFESGMVSKVSRSVPLAKVQDVTVRQSISQRLVGMGDLSIETAGETSRLTITSINSPRVVAENILDRVAAVAPPKQK